MSNVTQEIDTQTASTRPLGMMGTYEIRFYFEGTSSQSKRELLRDVPSGAKKATIAMKGFYADFTENTSRPLGRFAVEMGLDGLIAATCTMTLIEHKHDREWQGNAAGIVTYYG